MYNLSLKLSLNESQVSYAQQFLSFRGTFEVDNCQNSLLKLDNCLFSWSLNNRGFVSNYLHIFVKTILRVSIHL